jgi:NAD(P)-dependent dehydrogenase (short-subunit alcohol dehydrogenase family)
MAGTSPAMTENIMEFSGRQVIVTGGTGALGTAVVGKLHEYGAHCRVPYVLESHFKDFPLRGDKRVELIQVTDLAEEPEVERLYEGLPNLWASIHIAGGFAASNIADTNKAGLMAQIDSNLTSCFLCCRMAVIAMKKAGGRIVNVASRQALEPRTGAGMVAYIIAKGGVAALTVALAEEVAGDGILVNAVAPSIMDTSANRKAMPKADFDKWPKVEDVAATILFLASPENTVTRGAIVPVYGKS